MTCRTLFLRRDPVFLLYFSLKHTSFEKAGKELPLTSRVLKSHVSFHDYQSVVAAAAAVMCVLGFPRSAGKGRFVSRAEVYLHPQASMSFLLPGVLLFRLQAPSAVTGCSGLVRIAPWPR